MPNRNSFPSILTATAMATVLVLLVLVYCVLSDVRLIADLMATDRKILLAIPVLFFLLYAVLGFVQLGAIEARLFTRGPWWQTVAGVVAVFVAIPVTITWLLWIGGAGWPLGSPTSYAGWAAGVTGAWALLMPGALLQASALLRSSRPAPLLA
jgi:hypothetical protein